MIKAVIFDLDGTLVKTENLKAFSYARAAVVLSPTPLAEAEVLEAFKDVVGLSRQEVAEALLQRFALEKAAKARMVQFGVTMPWQAFAQLRLTFYEEFLRDHQILHNHLCRYNVGLLNYARASGFRTGLATMSHTDQAKRVLHILNLHDKFAFVATRDDVEHGKPNPEIYLLVARQLGTPPAQCLVIEDSPTGVKAALAARMSCIVVTNDLTRESVHRSNLIDARWIVDDAVNLKTVAEQLIKGKELVA